MKALLIISCLLTSNIIISQTNQFDQRLLEKYSQNELVEMQQNNPDRFNSIVYSLDHGFYFVDVPSSKNINDRISGEVTITDINNFNFLMLGINFLENDYQYYKVKNLDKLLVVKSSAHINEEIKK